MGEERAIEERLAKAVAALNDIASFVHASTNFLLSEIEKMHARGELSDAAWMRIVDEARVQEQALRDTLLLTVGADILELALPGARKVDGGCIDDPQCLHVFELGDKAYKFKFAENRVFYEESPLP